MWMRNTDGVAVERNGGDLYKDMGSRVQVFVVMDARAKLFQLRRHHAEAGGYAQNNSQNFNSDFQLAPKITLINACELFLVSMAARLCATT
jgi:hypothetical protein